MAASLAFMIKELSHHVSHEILPQSIRILRSLSSILSTNYFAILYAANNSQLILGIINFQLNMVMRGILSYFHYCSQNEYALYTLL